MNEVQHQNDNKICNGQFQFFPLYIHFSGFEE